MNFEFQNVVMHILKFFFLCLRFPKKYHQDFNLLHTYYTCYTSLVLVKNDEKWFTYSVLSPFLTDSISNYFISCTTIGVDVDLLDEICILKNLLFPLHHFPIIPPNLVYMHGLHLIDKPYPPLANNTI